MQTVKLVVVGDGGTHALLRPLFGGDRDCTNEGKKKNFKWAGVGKSALTIQFVDNHFMEEYDPTVEDSYVTEQLVDSVPVKMHIVDTAGQEEYRYFRCVQQSQFDSMPTTANQPFQQHARAVHPPRRRHPHGLCCHKQAHVQHYPGAAQVDLAHV